MDVPLSVALTAVAALLVSPLLGLLVFVRRRKARARRLLSDRTPLDAQTFGVQFFGSDPRTAQLAGHLRTLLEARIPFGLQGLRPEDRPFDDLWMHQWDHRAAFDMIEDVIDEYGVRVGADAFGPGRTFADLVHAVASCLPEQPAKLADLGEPEERHVERDAKAAWSRQGK